jgi:phospholipid/cholesterol/gamma-HCH transport system ATP-binding protein
MVESAPVVALRGVHCAIEDFSILHDINLEVHPGEVVGLIGPGGHGKSVLLKLIAGLMEASSGQIQVLGQDVVGASDLQLAQIRASTGYLFQNYALFDFMTVAENVAFPLQQLGVASTDEIDRRVLELLSEVGLANSLELYPRELSGGMKKRVGLARAVITHPELSLYDDPSAGLDPVTSSKIFNLIARIQSRDDKPTSIVVSHDIDRMKVICQRYVMLYEGRIIFDGPEEAIKDAGGMVSQFFYGAIASGEDRV